MRNMLKKIASMFALAFVAIAVALPASALDLVTNGGFESGTALSGNSWHYHDSTYKTDSWSGGSGRQNGSSTWASSAYAGSYVMFFQQSGAASQSINFPVAGTYRVSFAYTARSDANYGNHYRGVSLGSLQLIAYTVTGSDTSWHTTYKDFVVTAPGPQTLNFYQTKVNGDNGSSIDAVSCYLIKPVNTVTDCSSWRQVRAVLEAGYSVRLVKDIYQDDATQTGVGSGRTQFIDLNGHTLYAYNANDRQRLFYASGGHLTIKDTVGGGAIDGRGTSCKWYGGCVVSEGSGSTVTLDGDFTIRNFANANDSGGEYDRGGAIWVESGCTFNIKNCTITNCSSTAGGGAIYNKGTVTMSGGTIVDCRSEGSANGGAIFHEAGTLTLSGGMITNCASKVCGGGVRATAGTFNLSGTKIVDCRSNRNGNGIQMHGSLTFNMTGGEVVGCGDIAGSSTSAGNHGGAILIWDNVTANIKGGVIANNSSAAGGGAITYGGTCAAVAISGGVFTNNVCAGGMELLYRSSGSKTASVTGGFFDKNPITTSANTTFSAVAETVTGYVAGNPGAANKDGELSGGTYPFCPTNELYTGVGVTIAPDATLSGSGSSWTITSTNFVECSNWIQVRGNLMAGNNVILISDVEQDSSGQMQLNGSQKVMIDLNGHTIKANTRVFDLVGASSKLTMLDSVGGGVIDGQNISRTYAGGCVKVCSGTTFVFEGGTIQNFKVTSSNGGAVYSDGTITMNGGTITNCAAVIGGGVYNNGSFTMNEGVIENCASTTTTDYSGGGAIYMAGGTFTMNGGTICNNTSVKSAGAIFGVKAATININGGTISGNVSGQCGGAYYGGSTVTIRGGRIINNRASSDGALSYSGPLTIYGGVITNNTATSRNMTINACQNSGTIYASTIYGGIIDGFIGYDAGVSGTSINIYGGLFEKDPATTITGFNRGAATVKNTKVLWSNGWYLVGVTPASDKDAYMTGGTYTFCPTNAEYAAAGIALAGDTKLTGAGTSWAVAATNAVPCTTWDQVKSNLAAGNDVVITNDMRVTSTAVGAAGKTQALDLNGCTLSMDNAASRAFLLNNCNLTLKGEGVFDGNGITCTYAGQLAYLGNTSSATLTIEDGVTIRNMNAGSNNGGAIYIQTGTLTMNDGTITNCASAGGGAVYVAAGGRFEQKGGLITGCRSSASGGAISVPNVSSSGGTYVLSGGALVGNTSATYGGAVFIGQYGKMSFNDGVISNNTANGTVGGGGICSSGRVTMKGGKIVDNKSTGNANSTAIYSNIDDSDAIYGGVIEGTIYRDATADLYLYGGVFDRDQSAYCASGYTCYKVGDNYVVGVTPATDAAERLTGGSYTFCPTNELYASVGLSVADEATLIDLGSNWKVASSNPVSCTDWETVRANLVAGNDVELANDIAQGSGKQAILESGQNVTLDLCGKKITMTSEQRLVSIHSATFTLADSVGGGVVDGSNVNRTGSNGACVGMWKTDSVLNIKGGTIQNFKNTVYEGGAIYANAGGTITMDGGTISNCCCTASGKHGGAIYCGGTITINGGKIANCSVVAAGGGGVFVAGSGTLTVNGGEFVDNSAGWGGALYGQNGSVFNVYGGYFRGNSATSGGHVCCYDSWVQKCNIYGGVFDGYDPQTYGTDDARAIKLQNGKTTVGSNIYVIGANMVQDADKAFTVGQFTFPLTNELYAAHGVAVAAGSSVDKRGSYWAVEDGSVVECSTWQEVAAAALQGRNVKLTDSFTQTSSPISTCYLGQNQQVKLDLNGYTITKANGLWLFCTSSNGAKLTIEDSAGGGKIVNVSGGTVGAEGGCIYVPNGELVLNGGTLSGFKSTKSGGCIYVNTGAMFTMNGGKITGCTSAVQGGGVYVSAGSRFEMHGGEISGNTVTGSDGGTGCGGGIRNAGTTIVYGGRIASNSASRYAGGIYNNGGTLEIYGGTLTGNSAPSGKGGAIDCDAGRIMFYGGVVTGNTGGNFLIENANGMTVCGGVFDANPASVSNSALGTGCVSRLVGTKYVVGKEALGFPIDSIPTIVNGEYTFCPTNAEYAAAGIAADIVGSTFDAGEGVWKLTAKKPIGVSTWEQLKTTLESGFDAKLTADIADHDGVRASLGNVKVTLDLNGYILKKSVAAQRVLTLAGGSTLKIVGSGAFDGDNVTSPWCGACFSVEGTGNTLVLDGDFEMRNFKSASEGGALYIAANNAVVMNGGTITNCTAASNGGAVSSAGTFTMSNGVIMCCQAIGSVASSIGGGGVYNIGGTFDMVGGLITGCSATNGTGSNAWNGGGGICNYSGTTHIRGTISNCTARCAAGVGGRGGTIYLYDEGAIIRNYCSYTTPSSCGGTGALIDGGHFTMYGGRICDNYGPAGTAGCSGVLMWSSGNTFTMYGGIIAGNTNSYNTAQKQVAVQNGKAVLNGGLLEQEPILANVQCASGTFTVPCYRKVDDRYVVGKAIGINANDELTHGIYTFCLTNAFYETAGLAVDTVNSTLAYTNEAWYLTSNAGAPVNASSWAQLCAALEAGYSVKLANDIVQTGAQPILSDNQVVTVDLNGYTIDRKSVSGSYWCLATSSTNVCLTITDTSAAQTGRILGDPTKSHGTGGNALSVGKGKMIINGGIFEGMYATAGGGCAYVTAGATLEMNGGTITGCKSTGTGGYGAGVRCHGTFVMNGGTITNCAAEYYGGGVAVGGGATFQMNGGTIAGCTATKDSTANGGGVWTAGTVELDGGTIANCSAKAYGGGIYQSTDGVTCTLKRGTITGCSAQYAGTYAGFGGTCNIYDGMSIASTAVSDAGSVFVQTAKAKLNVYGGTFTGTAAVAVTSWEKATANVYGGHFDIASVDKLFNTGSTTPVLNVYGGVYGADPTGNAKKTFGTGCAATQVGDEYVVGKGVYVSGTTLKGGQYWFCPTNALYAAVGLTTSVDPVEQATTPTTWTINAKWYCICGDETKEIPGHVHEKVMFLPWAPTTPLPTGAGNYYLTDDVQLTAQWAAANEVVLDLAGHSVTQTTANARVMYVPANVTFTLTDSVGGGKLTGGNITADHGAGVYVNAANAKFIMYGGSICGNTAKSGAGMYINTATSSVKIYGGFIENNTAAEWGGGICMSGGTHEIRNCVIRNNQATGYRGGAFRFDNTTVEFIDCVITNNVAANHGGFSANNSYSTKIALGGTTVITNNHIIGQTAQNNLAVESGRMYTASTLVPLTDGAQIGVSTDVTPGSIPVTGINATDYAKYFFSDNAAYAIVNDLNQVKLTTVASVCAKIGETPYSSLQLALSSAVDGDTVKLVRNTTESVIVGSDGDITIDLAGFVLQANGGSAMTLSASANLTLTNSNETVTNYFTVGSNGLWTWNNNSKTGAIDYETLTARPAANVVIAIKGGCITGASAKGIYQNIGSKLIINGVSIVGNTGDLGGGVYQTTTAPAYLTLNSGRVCGNRSTCHGGGLYSHGGGTFTINGGDVAFNIAANAGGGICNGNVNLNGGRLSWNSCTYDGNNGGGGIFTGGKVVMTGGEIVGNSTTKNGGGIHAVGMFEMSGGVISNCTAASSGGVCVGGTTTITGGEIVGCRATSGGGGAFSNAGTLKIYGGRFMNNTSKGYAGLCYSGSTCYTYFYGGVFSNNRSDTTDNKAIMYVGDNWQATGKLYGGVFDVDPTATEQSSETLILQGAAAVTKIGDNYVVGEGIAYNGANELIAGTYTFNPENAEYVAAGIVLADMLTVNHLQTTPKTWWIVPGVVVHEPNPPIPLTTFKVLTNGAEIAKMGGRYFIPSNCLYAAVAYEAASGYYFENGLAAITNAVDASKDPAAHPAAPVEPRVPSIRIGKITQRYPWNGKADVVYKARNWPASDYAALLVVSFGDQVHTNAFDFATRIGGFIGTHTIDLKEIGILPDRGRADFEVIVKEVK